MKGNIQIYCINSEYKGRWGNLPVVNPILLYNIVIDGITVGATASEWTKEYPVEIGWHKISVNISRWRSSPPLDVEVKGNQTTSLLCGINRKGNLFIEPDQPLSAIKQQESDEEVKDETRINFWASIWLFIRVLSLLGFVFLYMELSMVFHANGLGQILIIFLSCVFIILVGMGFSWIYGRFLSLRNKS
jgi:hypothetical protein